MTDKKSKSVWVVIPAAGSGQRMKSEVPKQYLGILDKPIIEHTLNCFLTHSQIAGVVVVISDDDQYWESLNFKSDIQVQTQVELKSVTEASANQAPVFVVEINVKSDSTRSDSVMQGLSFLRDEHDVAEESWVMIHDAARPCLSKSDIDALLELRDTGSVGGILASPVRDTMKRVVELSSSTKITELSKTVSHTEPRANLWHALTPQMFQLGALSAALGHCKVEGIGITDECSAMENIGANPVIVEGSHNNIKVTFPSDLALATFFLSSKTSSKISTKH